MSLGVEKVAGQRPIPTPIRRGWYFLYEAISFL